MTPTSYLGLGYACVCVSDDMPRPFCHHRRVRILGQLDQGTSGGNGVSSSGSGSASISDAKSFKQRRDLLVELSMLVTACDTATATSAAGIGGVADKSSGSEEKKEPDVTVTINPSDVAMRTSSAARGSSKVKDVTRSESSESGGIACAKTFSMRALECRVGSIHDFVAVLTSPGQS